MKFFDFCAGIGGGRIGMEAAGHECVGFAEINSHAIHTYELLFGHLEKNYGDVVKINPKTLPDFDVLLSGFPCQPFSIAGERKGLQDPRGTVIYNLINILREKQVPYFILENVKGLLNHDKGKTLSSIISALKKEEYNVEYRVINSRDYGVPQSRERIYIIGQKEDIKSTLMWPTPIEMPPLSQFLIDNQNIFSENSKEYQTFLSYLDNKYNYNRFDLKKLLMNDYVILDTRQSDLRIYKETIPTLRAHRHGILYTKNKLLFRLSGFEALLFQGFPVQRVHGLKQQVKNGYLLQQAGNAMTVSVVENIAKSFIKE